MNYATIVRIVSLPLGLASALVLAKNGYGFSLPDLLERILGLFNLWLGEILSTIPITELYEKVARSLGIDAALQAHWKHIFVLLWLLFGAYARAISSESKLIHTLFHILWGGICSLSAALLAGSAQFDGPSVVLWPIAGFFLYFSGVGLWVFASQRERCASNVLAFAAIVIGLVVTAGAAYLAASPSDWLVVWMWNESEQLRSPGLTLITAAIFASGVFLLIFGLPNRGVGAGSPSPQWMSNPGRKMGLDMLSIVAGAAILLGLSQLSIMLHPAQPASPVAVAGEARTFNECTTVYGENDYCLRMVRVEGTTAETGPYRIDGDLGKPTRMVSVRTFWLSQTEVTNGQFAVFVQDEPTHKAADTRCPWKHLFDKAYRDHPITCINWSDAVDYARWLSRKSGRHYRLPTAAEWKYAASAGQTFRAPWGEDVEAACNYGNFYADPKQLHRPDCRDVFEETSPVGSFPRNGDDLFDMFGNVWEWTEDCPADAVPWTTDTSDMPSILAPLVGYCARAIRGGGWNAYAVYADSMASGGDLATPADWADIGFRIARVD